MVIMRTISGAAFSMSESVSWLVVIMVVVLYGGNVDLSPKRFISSDLFFFKYDLNYKSLTKTFIMLVALKHCLVL